MFIVIKKYKYFSHYQLFKFILEMNETGPLEVAVTPPDSLVKYDAPIFVGLEPSVDGIKTKSKLNEQNSKLEDMLNAMIPPRLDNYF